MGENPKPRHDDRQVYRTGLGEGFAGVINELLIQLQSFDEPTKREKLTGWGISKVNRMLPARFEIRKRPPVSSNILVIGATNRAVVARPRAAAPGSLRPLDPLRRAGPRRPARDHRLLHREEGARPRARQGGATRPARGAHPRLLAGDDRAPLRRGAGLGAARRSRGDGVARPPVGEAHRGDRSREPGRVHRAREARRSRRTRPGTRPSPTSWVSGASSRCSRSSAAAARSACSRTPTPRSGSCAPARSCSPTSRSASAGWWRRRSGSASPAPVPVAT